MSGEPLVQRDDDKEETVRNRLEVYQNQTRPLVDYYSSWAAEGTDEAPKYVRIQGVGKVEDITQQIFDALKKGNK